MTEAREIGGTQAAECEDNHTGGSVETLKRAIMDNLYYRGARIPAVATRNDWYLAVAYTVRDRILDRWIKTLDAIVKKDVRIVSYLSAEFLMGPHLVNNMINLGIYEQMKEAATQLGLDLEALIEQEEEPGLGNGGLGSLAACSWTLWPPWKSKRSATGFATNSGSSTRKSATAGRSKKRTSGCALETPGKLSGRKSPLRSIWPVTQSPTTIVRGSTGCDGSPSESSRGWPMILLFSATG